MRERQVELKNVIQRDSRAKSDKIKADALCNGG
jgi:hypothetical protein